MDKGLIWVELKDGLAKPGCPVCNILDEGIRRYFAYFLDESITSAEARLRLIESHGWCARHTLLFLSIESQTYGDHMSYSILAESLLRAGGQRLARAGDTVRRGIGKAASHRWARARQALLTLLRPRRGCAACEVEAKQEESFLGFFVEALTAPGVAVEMAELYRHSEGLCHRHLVGCLGACAEPEQALALLDAETPKVEALAVELADYVRKHEHRYRSEPLGRELDAWARAARKLAGHQARGEALDELAERARAAETMLRTPSAGGTEAEHMAMNPPTPRVETGVERNVVTLGWVAFFGGLAQDMIQPVLPVFYTTVLGLNKEFIGLIEGALTTLVSLAKIGAGYLSDALGVRKAIVFVGYGLSAVGRFSLAFAGSGAAALGLRLTDGLGKGLKDAPRDALVANSAGGRKLGFAFGVQRTLDTMGSVVGPLLAFALLRAWVAHPDKYRLLFLTAGLIAAVPLVIIGFLVRESSSAVKKQAVSLAVLRGPFAWFLVVILLFALGNSSDAFIILRAQGVGVPAALIPVIYAFFNLVSASTAMPAGHLADRIGRRRMIGYGWGVYALAYAGFALARAPWMIWALYGFYGLFYSLTEGSAKAMVAELVPEQSRGAAYGLYSAATGLVALPASVIAGLLWTHISPAAPFAFGALLAAVAFVGLQLVPRAKMRSS